MGIVRLAKCLRMLDSIEEYKNRENDVQNKISGNRVYMDFVSIVYKIQENVAKELNYLLFSFMLIDVQLLNAHELTSIKLKELIIKYKKTIINITGYDAIMQILQDLDGKKEIDIDVQDILKMMSVYINPYWIQQYVDQIKINNLLNQFVYENVVYFITDMLTQKVVDVEYILIAFDGIPSYGKIQEQRHRRYMRYAYIEFKKNIGSRPYTHMNKNVMNTLIMKIREDYDKIQILVDVRMAIDYVYSKYHDDSLQNDIKNGMNNGINIEINVMNNPYGEGEKLLMDKLIKDCRTYGNDKSYVFYSPDGDSVILCLYAYIKTKINNLNVVKTYSLTPSSKHNEQTQYVNIKLLYNNIIQTIEKNSHKKIEEEMDRDSICTDFIFLMNLYGNDFIHQIPTMEISTTIMDLLYIYSKFIVDNEYILKEENNRVVINIDVMGHFFKEVGIYEQWIMLDTYILDADDKSRIIKYFGNVFACRYMLDFRDLIVEYKNNLLNVVTDDKNNLVTIKQSISDAIDSLNEKSTVTGKKYGDIWMKMEVKNIDAFATKIMTDTDYLKLRMPKFMYMLRPKKNKNETDIMNMVSKIEEQLIKSNCSIDIDTVSKSNDFKMRDFSFDYYNIRANVPHNQMITTDKDIDLYLLEWKSGKWMNILNSYPYELGYDWKTHTIKTVESEMKRYQYDMLNMNDTQTQKLVGYYLKTLSWIVDYYMNTNYVDTMNTNDTISTWSYNFSRSPFINHINQFIADSDTKELKRIMKNTYKNSLIPVDQYIESDKHQMYIYPQSEDVLALLPDKYKINFPNMEDYVKSTIKTAEFTKNNINGKYERVFDCRHCPYFSKCLFKGKDLGYKDLMNLNIDINNKSTKSIKSVSWTTKQNKPLQPLTNLTVKHAKY